MWSWSGIKPLKNGMPAGMEPLRRTTRTTLGLLTKTMLPRGNILNLYSTRDKILAINIATEIAPVRTTRQTMTPMRSTDFMSKTQQLNISSLSTAKSSATGTRRGSSTDLFQQQKKERPYLCVSFCCGQSGAEAEQSRLHEKAVRFTQRMQDTRVLL